MRRNRYFTEYGVAGPISEKKGPQLEVPLFNVAFERSKEERLPHGRWKILSYEDKDERRDLETCVLSLVVPFSPTRAASCRLTPRPFRRSSGPHCAVLRRFLAPPAEFMPGTCDGVMLLQMTPTRLLPVREPSSKLRKRNSFGRIPQYLASAG